MRLQQFFLLSVFNKILVFFILIFPSLAVTVKHGGTTIYLLLFLVSIFSAKAAINSLLDNEKYVLYGLLIFVAVMLFGFLNTDDYTIAIHQLERYLRLIAIIPIYLMFTKKKLDLTHPLLIGCVLASFVMAIQAFYEVEVLNSAHASGGYNKIVFGYIAVIFSGVCTAGLLTSGKNKIFQIVLILGILFGLYASLQSYARASWLAVVAVTIVLAILYKDDIIKKHWRKMSAGLLIIVVIGSFWQPHNLSIGIKAGIEDLKEYSVNPVTRNSWGDRINMWHSAWVLFLEKPLMGVGVGDYNNERQRLIDEGRVNNTYGFSHAHNHYMNVLAENGIIGLVALIVCIFFLPARVFYQHWYKKNITSDEKFWALTGLIVLTCFCIFGIAEVWLGRNPFVNVYCMFILVSLVGIHANKTTFEKI